MPQEPMTVGRYVAHVLRRAGVTHVFGFPGETSLPFYIGMQQEEAAGIQHVLARCPRCAAYMADSYARVSGRIGICDAPGGIGSPFATPALHEARNSSIPVLFIGSGVDRAKRGKWSTSECDQQGLFTPVTKRTVLADDPALVAERLSWAVHTAISPRTGPVFLELPADVLTEQLPMPAPDVPTIRTIHYPYLRPQPAPELLEQVAHALRQAKCPVIVAGGGTHLSAAVTALRELVQACGIPAATTLNGKGAMDERSPLSLGVTGSKGNLATNDFVRNADLVLILGSKLGDKSTDGYRWPRPGQTAVHVDADPRELQRTQPGYLPVLSDVLTFCRALMPLVADYRAPQVTLPVNEPFWEQGATDHLCRLITRSLTPDAVVVADASVASGWAGAAIQLTSPQQRLLTPRGSGSLGFALPAAIGAQFARPQAQVVAIGGDGGFAMAMHEMETATRYQLPILFFLLNNQRLGLIDRHATELLGGEAVSRKFHDIDWQAAAAAFGWRTLRIESPAELEAAWPTLLPTRQPTLVEYRIAPTELAPDFAIIRKKHGG